MTLETTTVTIQDEAEATALYLLTQMREVSAEHLSVYAGALAAVTSILLTRD